MIAWRPSSYLRPRLDSDRAEWLKCQGRQREAGRKVFFFSEIYEWMNGLIVVVVSSIWDSITQRKQKWVFLEAVRFTVIWLLPHSKI